jgi:hypothetical protein
MLEISQLILMDFYCYLERFITIQPPNAYVLRRQEVRDEYENYITNLKLLSDSSIFLKSCHEVYCSLTKQIDDLLIPKNNFIKLQQYLSRLRFNMSYLLQSMKNLLKNYKNDLVKYDSCVELNNIFHVKPEILYTEDKDKNEENLKSQKKQLEDLNINKFLRSMFIKMKKSNKDTNNNLCILNDERMKNSRLRNILDK